jgi:hypothetical protein
MIYSDMNGFPESGFPVLADFEDRIILNTLYGVPLKHLGYKIDVVGNSRLLGALVISGGLSGVTTLGIGGALTGATTIGASGIVTLSGGNLVMTTGSILMATGEIGSVLARIKKAWLQDLYIKNRPICGEEDAVALLSDLAYLQSRKARIGTASNYFEVEADGTLKLNGDATTHEDLRVPMTSTKLGGSKDPGFSVFKTNGAGSQGIFIYWFDKSAEEELYFAVQMPHSWKGTAITPHIHWIPKTNGALNATVEWGFEYSWSAIGGTFGNSNIIYTKTTTSGDTTLVADKHYMSNFADITLATPGLSSMLICRVFRNATDGTDDTYDDDAGVLEFDFHYEIDSLGSHTPTVK